MGQFDELLAQGMAETAEQDADPKRTHMLRNINNAIATYPEHIPPISDKPINPATSGRPAIIPPVMSEGVDEKTGLIGKPGSPGYVSQDDTKIRIPNSKEIAGKGGTGKGTGPKGADQVMRSGTPKKPDVSEDVKKYAERREARRAAKGIRRRGQTGSPDYAATAEEVKKTPAASFTSQQLDAYINPPRSVDTEAERLSQVHAESNFNEEQEKSGSSMRSRRGVTYDINEEKDEPTWSAKARGYRGWTDTSGEKWRRGTGPTDKPLNPKGQTKDLKEGLELPYEKLDEDKSDARRLEDVRKQVESEKKPSLTSMLGKGAKNSSRSVSDLDNAAYDDGNNTAGRSIRTDHEVSAEADGDSASDKALMTGAKEYEQKNAKKTTKPYRVSAQGRKGAVGGKAGETSAEVNKSTTEEPWDSEGNVKPRYNDFENHPELTTTIQEKEVPEEQVAALKNTKRLAGMADKPHIGQGSSSNLDLDAAGPGDVYEEGSNIIKNNVNVGRQMRKVYIDPGSARMPRGKYEKPEVSVRPGEPIRHLYDEAPEETPKSFKEVLGDKSGNPITTDEQRQKIAQEGRGPKTGTHVLQVGDLALKAKVGLSEEQSSAAAGKRAKLEKKIGDKSKKFGEYKDTRQEESTLERARNIAVRDNFATKKEHLDNPNWWSGPKGQLVTAKAKLLGHFGMGDDLGEEQFDKALGGRSLGDKINTSVENQIKGMYVNLKNSEDHAKDKSFTFKDGKEVSNDPNLAEAHFRASKGAIVPMSQTDHPEHPLKGGSGTLTGSLAPLKVVEDGVKRDKHRGWSVSTVSGKRIFEKNPDTVSGTPMSQLDKEGIENGLGPEAHTKNVLAGKETGVMINGKDTAEIAAERRDSDSQVSRDSSKGHANSVAAQLETASQQIHEKMNAAGVPVSTPSAALPKNPTPVVGRKEVENIGLVPEDRLVGAPIISKDDRKLAEDKKITRSSVKNPSFTEVDSPTPDERNAASVARGEKKSDSYARTREVKKKLVAAGVPATAGAVEARGNFESRTLAPKSSKKKVSPAHAEINEAVSGGRITAEEGYELKYPKKSVFK